jgi:integrase
MSKINSKNEKMKRLFEKYCKYSRGDSEKSIKLYFKAIYAYEEFTNFECFSKFNDDKAIEFRESLVNSDNKRALSTVYDYLRYLKVFFIWLSNQQGYKKPINKEHIDCLRLSREQTAMALAPQRERYPTLEIVQKVVHGMPVNTELDLRDRALISFTLLSGMRDNAIITLPIKCFDIDNLEVYHDAKNGVKTKYSDTYQTYLYTFDNKMLDYVINWYNYLVKEKLYPLNAPLFPRNKVEQAENSKSFICNTFEPEFWKTTTPITEIFKQRFEQAGMEYYSPHTFRHLANHLTKKACCSIEEFQAVSQNFGHKNMGTTFSNYGRLPAYQVRDVISGLDFSGKKKKINKSELKKLLEEMIEN